MIELKQLKDITLNKDNPRIFEQQEIDEIVKSLKKSPHMLWLKPVVLNALSIVLAGNLRTTGAKAIFQLGTNERGKILKAFEENIQESDLSELSQKEAIKNAKTLLIDKLIPVVYANFLTKEQETEFLIKDNAHLGKWDIDALTANFDLTDIAEWGVDESLWGEAKDFNDDEGRQKDNSKGTPSVDDYDTGFSLKEGDREPFQQMTFTLADEQAEFIKNALSDMKKTDEYKYAETMGNENSNGNSLYLIIASWVGQRI